MEQQWWSKETALLARQVNTTAKPVTFLLANKYSINKDAEDMGVRIGDTLVVTGYPRYANWYERRNDWTGQTGIFPTRCAIEGKDAVQVAKEYSCLIAQGGSSQPRVVSLPTAPAAPEPSPEVEMHHSEKKMEFWGNLLKLGAAVILVGGGC